MKNKITFMDVLAKNGETPEQFIERTKDLSPYDRGHEKVKLIVDYITGDKTGEKIWYPFFDKIKDKKKPSGSGLSFYGSDCDYSGAHVAARLKYVSEEDSDFAGENFTAEYEEMLLSEK